MKLRCIVDAILRQLQCSFQKEEIYSKTLQNSQKNSVLAFPEKENLIKRAQYMQYFLIIKTSSFIADINLVHNFQNLIKHEFPDG